MALQGASAVLGPHVATDPGASLSAFMARPFPAPTAGAPHRPLWGQHPPPLMTPPFPSGGPLVLPAFSRTPLVAGEAGLGPNGTGTCNVIVQVRSEQGCSVTPQTQTIVLTQAPLSWSGPGALCGGAACPAPLFVTASAVETSMPASAHGGSQAGKGGLAPSLPPPAQPPVAQLTTVVPPVNARPQPHGASRSRTTASPEDSCNPKSVYENFRRWQRFKSLARRHLPQSPDAEALSCFLIPVLRSLARLKPTMTLEEGVWRAVQEWQSRSNFDRLIYYEMAGKFMEFEMEEEMQMQKLQWVKVAQGMPPPAPPKPERRGPPAAEAGPQPACVPRKAGSRAQPSRQQPRRPPRRPESKAPKEIPPEAVREYVDIMEGLLGPGHSAPGGPAGEWGEDGKEPQQDEAATYPDPGLLSYIDELCSQEDFITKVEAVIHPCFLAELLSSEPQLDLLALAEKLEQEEGLSLAELVEKRLMALNTEEGVQAPPRLCAARSGPTPEHETGPGKGLRGQGCAYPGLGPRDAPVLREAPLARDTRGLADVSSEDEEELPSLAFLLASQHSLLPWGLSQSPAPASVIPSPGAKSLVKKGTHAGVLILLQRIRRPPHRGSCLSRQAALECSPPSCPFLKQRFPLGHTPQRLPLPVQLGLTERKGLRGPTRPKQRPPPCLSPRRVPVHGVRPVGA
ncbi:NUT family member 2G-like [Lontra canadensis]|uniref:NUT family member 2G-like n=1 Tax=Lontra canadensis TaxID=76717 RepID=UPI0013F3607C|nr:NUT family member 2G-like [Lontra canadensis]